ncbi:hypothetical protein D9M71_410490 [compost metagenome]
MGHVVGQGGNAQAGTDQLGNCRNPTAAVFGHHPGHVLAAPDHGRVILHGVVRGDPGHAGRVFSQAFTKLLAPTDHVGRRPQATSDQMLRRRIGQAQGQVGIPPAEVGKGIGGRQLQRQCGIRWHELGQRRQQQAVQHGVGAGQAHCAADHLFTMLQCHARRIQRLLGALGLLGQGLGGAGGDVTLAAFDEQRGTQGGFHAPDRTKNSRYIDLQQLGGLGQGAAADQGEHQ